MSSPNSLIWITIGPKLMDVYDTLNQRFGCVEQGGIAEVQMRRQMLTPQYTTRWVDLPKIKC
ncbi:DUF4113 domain-containing protein [Vibrio vulnificus]